MGDPRMMSNMFNSGVQSIRQENGALGLPLPLNLIAFIISYLEQPSDLARMCRTCRVFHYMTLPQLYTNVSLRSYDYIRYCGRDGRPQGCGMASPFIMGLNGLVSKNVAGYVKKFELCGEWKEYELQEHAKVGRVPDETMMLNTLVRVAIERMAVLDSFSWQLNTKILPTIWQGLSQKPSLTKLTIKFPTERTPRPIAIAPPLPNLQYLKVTGIDPLCYPDDLSSLLLGSKNLRHLKLHWSPRMRESREPSIHSGQLFGRLMTAQYAIPLQTIAIQNLYTYNDHSFGSIMNPATIQEITFLNSTSGLGDDGSTAFIDGPCRKPDDAMIPATIKMMRIDKVSRQQCEFLSHITGLERLYLIGPYALPQRCNMGQSNHATPLPCSPTSNTSNISSPGSTDTNHIMSLKDEYIEAITKSHGRTLKHLLLLPQWRLTDDDIAFIVRQCPNLEQLGIGAEIGNFKHLRLLVPFLTNLTSLRLLGSPDDPTFADKMRELDELGIHEEKIGEETVNREWSKMRFIELGAEDLIFEIGKREPREIDGKTVYRMKVMKRPYEQVKDTSIWNMDSLDI